MANNKKPEPEPQVQRTQALPVHLTTKDIHEALQAPLAAISYLTFKQVSDMTGFSRDMIYKLIEEEGFPVERFRSRIAFNVAELEKWFNKRRQAQLEEHAQDLVRYHAMWDSTRTKK